MKSKFTSMFGKFALLLGIALMLSAWTNAQDREITGTVTSFEDGSTLPGVSIVVKGTTIGTVTDVNGKYSITVPEDATTLVFSFVGMVTEEVPIEGRKVIDVSMVPDIMGLEEVVVIGYGEAKKEDLTGSVTAVSVEDFNQGSITSPQELISGKTAGVQITTNSGAPGEGATIRIRGGSSLRASNDPLIIIDGVPVDGTGI